MKSTQESLHGNLLWEGLDFSVKSFHMALIKSASETQMESIRSAVGKTHSGSALKHGSGWCQGNQREPSRAPLLSSVVILEGLDRVAALGQCSRKAIARNLQRIQVG